MDLVLLGVSISIWLMFAGIGIVAGVIAGLLGVGGGLVIVPVLLIAFTWISLPAENLSQMAVATSLATIIFTSLSSINAHHKHQAIQWNWVAWLVPGILFGAWFGVAFAVWISSDLLKLIFAIFLLLVSVKMLLASKQSYDNERTLEPGFAIWFPAASGIGAMSALVGIGGGTMTVPFLHALGANMRHAVATSAACGLPIAIAGFASFAIQGWGENTEVAGLTGYIFWPAVIGISMTSVLLAPVGARLAHRMDIRLLKKVFAGLLVLVAMVLLLR